MAYMSDHPTDVPMGPFGKAMKKHKTGAMKKAMAKMTPAALRAHIAALKAKRSK